MPEYAVRTSYRSVELWRPKTANGTVVSWKVIEADDPGAAASKAVSGASVYAVSQVLAVEVYELASDGPAWRGRARYEGDDPVAGGDDRWPRGRLVLSRDDSTPTMVLSA